MRARRQPDGSSAFWLMNQTPRKRTLATMTDIDEGPLNWGGAVSELPTGTVTLLLADVEGSTRLWETQPAVMADAVARLDETLAEAVAAHGGVRPVEQGEGDSFVIAFARATDAVACALDLQRAPLAPIKLRIGLHTGEIRLRDEGNYIGPTINRTARLRDLAHGGQTVLSGATEPLVVDQLPTDVTLTDLGTHPLRDLPRPERVIQLCHPDLSNDFPPLRTATAIAAHNLPAQLTSFIGRRKELAETRRLLADNRLVTLTGVGGTGKTRLAARVAIESANDFSDGTWYVDLAPISVPELVPTTVARALGLTDQPGQSTMETLRRFLRDRELFMVLDNCEHLIEATSDLVAELLGDCPGLTLLTTSREPLGVPGEVTWGVPSLSLTDEAIALFDDRARRARPGFRVTDDNIEAITEICRRLDGLPLAIELAAARIRALSVQDIVDSLHDRFRLLTGGARTVVRRQQTLRASVDWSHALLSDSERIMFRRLAVFVGGFDLDAARAVAGTDLTERYQVLDQLTLLVEKSLVVAEDNADGSRYRLLETVRQYALEKLGESGEADEVRSRHRDHYTSIAAMLDTPAGSDYEQRIEQANVEIDNLRSAFGWSLENADFHRAMALASSLQPLWTSRGRMREGQAWIDFTFDPRGSGVDAAVRARALADKAVLDCWVGTPTEIGMAQVEHALTIARELENPALLARTLSACGFMAGQRYDASTAQTYFTEAIELARASDDQWRLSEIFSWQANTAIQTGHPLAARAAGQEGLQTALAIANGPNARQCRFCVAYAHMMQGEIGSAIAQFRVLVTDCEAARDSVNRVTSLMGLGNSLAYQGQASAAREVGHVTLEAGAELNDWFWALGSVALTQAALVENDIHAAQVASDAAWPYLSANRESAPAHRAFTAPVIALAADDLVLARQLVDESISVATGWHLTQALMVRARIGFADGRREEAERDARDALACADDCGAHLAVPDTLEALAGLIAEVGGHDESARLFGAAAAIRHRMGAVRFKIYDTSYRASVEKLRNLMADDDFEAAWAEGSAMSVQQAIAYALRGRGERKRPSSGWESLTPAEHDVVRLVAEGLTNKDVAVRLFVSPRTVQSHLAHVFAKLGVTTRTQLAQEAARRG
jgi:predicted ATPase/class 3 adenylate cyclase/DNA-binding CsgD family transcriptional regulator